MSCQRKQAGACRPKQGMKKTRLCIEAGSYVSAIAPPRRKDSAHNNAILLLGKRSADDDAWYDCEVLFDKLKDSTAVEFQNILRIHLHGAEDSESVIISTAREARSRLRPPFKMLNSGLCLQMQIGEVVLASRAHENGPYYEACLQEIHRQRHSSEASCKCKFGLMWMDKKLKGVACTAPASQIKKVDEGTIEDFSMLFTWLQCTEKKESDQPEVSDIESDWEAMLDKEIEKITRIEDFDVKDSCTKHLAGNTTSQYCSSLLKHETRTERKQHRVPRSKSFMASSRMVIREMTHQALDDTKLRLSPLAARAALASRIQWLSSSFLKPSDDKSLGDENLEELPFIKTERNAVLADKSNLPESIVMDETKKPASKPKASTGTWERPRSHVHSFPGGKVITHKLPEKPLTMMSDSAAETKFDDASVINSKNFCTSEKEKSSTKKSTRRSKNLAACLYDSKMQLQKTGTLAVENVEQLIVEANMQTQGHVSNTAESCPDPGPATTDRTSDNKARRHASSSKTKPFPVNRPRKVIVTQIEKPSFEVKPSSAKRSRQLIMPHSNAPENSNMEYQRPYFASADQCQPNALMTGLQSLTDTFNRDEGQTKSSIHWSVRSPNYGVTQFVSQVGPCSTAKLTTKKAAVVQSEEGSADGLSSEKKPKVAKLPSGIKKGSMDVGIHKGLQASSLIKKGEDVSKNLKESLVKTRRTRGSKVESRDNKFDRQAPKTESGAALELDQCNQESCRRKPENHNILSEALHANFSVGKCASQQNLQQKTNPQGMMGLDNLETEVHLKVELHSDAHETNSITMQNVGPSSKNPNVEQGLLNQTSSRDKNGNSVHPLTEFQSFSCPANEAQGKICRQVRKGKLQTSELLGIGLDTKRSRAELAKDCATSSTGQKRRRVTRSAASAYGP